MTDGGMSRAIPGAHGREFSKAERAAMPAAAARRIFREGRYAGPTAGIAVKHVQANLIVLPSLVADAFEAYCRANPGPCPLLERLAAGDPEPKWLAPGADLRTDLPRYRVYLPDGSFEEMADVTAHYRGDHVAFLIGCSFSFDGALCEAGMMPRHVEQGTNVPMYRTDRQTTPIVPFGGEMVVSMRPIRRERVAEAYALTKSYERMHGSPIHHGDPSALGIADLARPDWGDPVAIREGETPVFWPCGVTSQLVALRALRSGAVDKVIAHAPGHMFIADRLVSEIVSRGDAGRRAGGRERQGGRDA
jgi:uncharacterized protein YcsI (UPF0317 family)